MMTPLTPCTTHRQSLLTSSSLPSLPTRAVSTMPSSGSAASAKAAGTASCHMSLSHFDCSHGSGLLLLLLLLLPEMSAAGPAALLRRGAAFTSDEAAALTAAVAALRLLLTPSCAVPAGRYASRHKYVLCLSKTPGIAEDAAARQQGTLSGKAGVLPRPWMTSSTHLTCSVVSVMHMKCLSMMLRCSILCCCRIGGVPCKPRTWLARG